MDYKDYILDQEEQNEQEQEGFKIDSLDLANWAFKKISILQREIEEKEAYAEREKERIDKWLAKETQAEKDSIAFFETHLVSYYQQLRAADPKAKLSTPAGKVSSRKRQPKWEIKDDAAIEYLQTAAPDKIETQYKYNKTEFKKMIKLLENGDDIKAIDENGEILDFVKVTPQEPSYTVKTED